MSFSFTSSFTAYLFSEEFSPGQAYNTKARLAAIGEIWLDLNFLFVISAMLVARRGLPSLKSSRAVNNGTILSECPNLKCPFWYLEREEVTILRIRLPVITTHRSR